MVEENVGSEGVAVRCVGFAQDLYTAERTLKWTLAQWQVHLERAPGLEYQDVANDPKAVQSYRREA